jgi:hypothetical protein
MTSSTQQLENSRSEDIMFDIHDLIAEHTELLLALLSLVAMTFAIKLFFLVAWLSWPVRRGRKPDGSATLNRRRSDP